MSLGTIAPSPFLTVFDDEGAIVPGALVYCFAAGTTTPLDTWFDQQLINANLNSNPVVCDAAGRCTMFLEAASYKFVLKKPDGSLIRTADNISATNLGSAGIAGDVFFFGGGPDNPITDVAYPAGTTYDKLMAGSSIYNIDSANLVGTYVLEGMLLSVGGVTVTAAIVDLDDGAPNTPLETIASVSVTGERVQSGPITFAAAGAAKNYGIKVKVSSGSGYVWGVRLVRTA